MGTPRVLIVGAGMGGLVAALLLSARGLDVTVLDKEASAGGKLRQIDGIDAGPTVLTMRGVLEEIFAGAGESLDAHLTLRPAGILARHAWDDGPGLDLFADLGRSVDAVGRFAGAAEARGFLAFSERARRIHDTLEQPFLHRNAPSLPHLLRAVPPRHLLGIDPFRSLWRETGRFFADPRLRQLFGRYATYCGSSPVRAPATLMLVSHVERSGVWLCDGGMGRIGTVLETLARRRGARFRFGARVEELLAGRGRCRGVRLDGGERLEAELVLCNADVAALSAGLFGRAGRRAAGRPGGTRSFSAMTLALRGRTGGFPLSRHSVFFSRDYPGEFQALADGQLPAAPTVYVCAQDRDDRGALAAGADPARERLLLVVNAPADGDHPANRHHYEQELRRCERAVLGELRRCGLRLEAAEPGTLTGPRRFAQLFPGTGGGLYGRATEGCLASFRRAGASSRLPGLYLAGGSAHPGPGLSMAALGGMMAAAAMLRDCASTSRSPPTATAGGTWTR